MAEWEAQEVIWKQTTEWVQKANEHNVNEMKEQRNAVEEPTENPQPKNPTWQALQECQITLPSGWLLQLMPRFTDGLKSTSCTGSDILFKSGVVDTSNPAITTIIKGRKLLGTIVNGE